MIITADGKMYSGSPLHIVKQLSRRAFYGRDTVEEFIFGACERAVRITGKPILLGFYSTDEELAEAFIKEAIRVGVLRLAVRA